jgi:TP901 family phage tail tape measure protein
VPNATVGVLRVLLTGNSAEFDAAMKKAGDSAKAWGKDLTQIGKQASDVGMALTKTLTLPIVGLAATSVKAASDFESSFAGIRKTVSDATDSMGELTPVGAKLAQGMRDLALTIPVNVNELNKIGEAAGQLGIKSENILGFTRVMADLGVTTNLSSDQAATSLARLANITGLPQEKFADLGNVIVHLGNNLATTEAEIVEFGLRIAGAGTQIGLSEGQILAFGAALSSVGINAEAGGTAISKVFIELASVVAEGGSELEEFAAIAGMTSEQFAEQFNRDAAGATVAFVEGLGRIKQEGGNVFGVLEDLGMSEVRLRDALLRASGAGDLLRDSLALQSDALREGNALSKEAEQRYKTFENQLALLWAQVRDVGIEFGSALLPILRDVIAAATPLVQTVGVLATKFAGMPEPLRLAVVGFGAMVAAIGPAIFIAGQMITAVGTLTVAFGTKGIAMRAMTALYPAWAAAMRGASVAVAGLTAVMGPLSIAIGGVTLAWLAWQKASAESGWIREISDGYQYAALRLMGYTAAQADAMIAADHAAQKARESKQALQDLGGATAPVIGGMKMLASHGGEVAASVTKAGVAAKGFSAELALTRQQVAALTAAQRAEIIAGDALGKSTSEIAEAMHLSEAAVGLFKEQLDKSAAATKKATEEKKEFWEAVNRLNENALPPYVALLQDVSTELGETEFFGKSITRSFDEQARAVGVLTDKYQPLKAAVVENRTDTEKAEKKTKEYKFSIEDLAGALTQLAQVSGDSFGGTVKHVSALITSVNAAQKAVETMVSGFKSLASGGGFQAIAQMTTGVIGLVTAVWSIGSALVSVVRGWFGVSAEVKKARAEVDTFQQSLTDTLTETQRASAGGVQWKMTVIAVRDAYLATGRSAAEAEAIVRQLWDTDRPDKARAAIEKINQVLGEQKLEQELLQEAIQEYGFSIEELGPKFQAQKLSEQAQRLVEHYAVLIESGVENGIVIDKMAEKTNDYLATALRTNAEIPKSMEPMLQAMVEQGLLTDENGEKLTDLGRITWAETMTQGFDRVVGAVERLIAALGGIPTEIGIDVVGTYIPPDIPDVTTADPGFASGTMGRLGQWMGDFGKGTPTMLHGREMVVPQGQIPALFSDMLSAASPSAPLSAGPVVGIPSMGSPGDLPVAAALAVGREAAGGGFDVSGVISELRSVRRLLSELPGDIKMGYKAALAGV